MNVLIRYSLLSPCLEVGGAGSEGTDSRTWFISNCTAGRPCCCVSFLCLCSEGTQVAQHPADGDGTQAEGVQHPAEPHAALEGAKDGAG